MQAVLLYKKFPKPIRQRIVILTDLRKYFKNAIRLGINWIIRFTISNGISIDRYDNLLARHLAIRGDLEMIKNMKFPELAQERIIVSYAIGSGHIKIIEYALKNWVIDEEEMIIKAVLANRVNILKLLNLPEKISGSLFGDACEFGDYKVVKFISERDKSIILTNYIQSAARSGNYKIVKFLIKNSEHHRMHFGRDSILKYSLNWACQWKKFKIAKIFLDIGIRDEWAISCAYDSGSFKLINYMNSIGINTENNEYEIINICRRGNLNEFINSTNRELFKNSAYSTACANGHLKIVKYIDENLGGVKGIDNITINSVCYRGHYKVFKYLIRRGLRINYGEMLNTAVSGNKINIVKYLVKLGHSVMDYKISYTGFEVLKFLLENGAHVGKTCIYGICRYGQLDSLKLINNFPKQLFWMNDAFRVAIENGHFEIVKYMVETGYIISDFKAALHEAENCNSDNWRNDDFKIYDWLEDLKK